MNASRPCFGILALLAVGCGADSTTNNTGGVDGPSGVSVVLSDYISTQVALSDLSGQTESESFISTGSTETDGLAFALSGDVVLPSSAPKAGQVVLLDRFGTNVVTWVDTKTAHVLAQLAVGTGFESNPSDYLEVGPKRAFITRWGDNANPGQEEFDLGGDVLIVDTASYAIKGSIELPRSAVKNANGDEAAAPYPPRPVGMTRVGDVVLVPLERLAADFSDMAEAVLVGIPVDGDEVSFELPLPGLKACGRPALAPDGKTFAVACTGYISAIGETEDVTQSALLVFDATSSPPVELSRFSASDLAGGPIQNDVIFATQDKVLLKTQTGFGAGDNNRWLAVTLATGATETLLEARPDPQHGGKGLVFGGMSCSPDRSDICLLADGDRGELARVSVEENGDIVSAPSLAVETAVGLPPRDVAPR